MISKAKILQKKIGVQAAIVGAVVVGCVGVMLLTGSLKSGAMERQTQAEGGRNSDSSQVATMRNQLDKSGDAEKRFITIETDYPSGVYAADSDAMKDWLRNAKDRFRFGNNFKLTLALEKKSENSALATLNYDVMVREPMKLEFTAMSDMHVFSFIKELTTLTPGFIRITSLEMTRSNDMTINSFRQLRAGLNPEFVTVKLEFTWVGVQPKAPEAGTAPDAAAEPGV